MRTAMMLGMELDEGNGSNISSGDFLVNETQFGNATGIEAEILPETTHLPLYLRITCLILFVVIFLVGTVGNIMVTMVIGCSRDMRTSTNIFLVNLSIADLLVLVVCTPTALIEVTYHPDRWILGFYMCKFVPFLELTLANTSVLTILAISFERYYAICRPLKANYVCTRSRAALICLTAWIVASIITSPMVFMMSYTEGVNEGGDWTARCSLLLDSETKWVERYTFSTILLFFVVPFLVLVVTYGLIARRLTTDRSALNAKNENHKARKQVVLMLGTVVFTFFLCLFPFRILTMIVLMVDTRFLAEYNEAYQNMIYFSRMLIYANSAINPLLYNVMSSKFKNGFIRLFNGRRKQRPFTRTGTFITNTTTNSTNVSINLGHPPFNGNGNYSVKTNGHYGRHKSLGHSSSLCEKNGSAVAHPDLLKTLVRTQSTNSTSDAAVAIPASIHNPQTVHYSNNHHTSGNSMRHNTVANGLGNNRNDCSNGRITGKSVQSHLNCNGAGRNGILINKGTTHIVAYNNVHDCSNGKQMPVKSDTVYSAYLPGARSETVL